MPIDREEFERYDFNKRRKEVLDAVVEFLKEHSTQAFSYMELGDKFGDLLLVTMSPLSDHPDIELKNIDGKTYYIYKGGEEE